MLRFTRPNEPTDFATRVQDARDHLTKKAGKGLGKGDFPNHWSRFKDSFAKAQKKKCGYCESAVIGTQHGDVEHFRPKGALEELPADSKRLGREKPHSTSVEGRELVHLCDEGYWWLAYDWSNYLLACQSCNESWKKCLFPVDETPRTVPPAQGTKETPLLLNPFDDPDPKDHLLFDPDLGQVSARNGSKHGDATIKTCGLDRESLRGFREQCAKRAQRHALVWIQAQGGMAGYSPGRSLEEEVVEDLRREGDERCPHAGMFRSIVEDITGCSWEDIVR